MARYYRANPKKYRARSLAYWAGHPVQAKENNARKRDKAKRAEDKRRHREANPELYREIRNRSAKNRKEVTAAGKRNYKARKRDADGKHTGEDILALYRAQDARCANRACSTDLSLGYHVDHIVALARGGSNWPENLQLLCPTCNLRKGTR